jgi:hypothetical protein
VVGIAAWSILTGIWVKALRAPIPGQPRFVPVVSTVVTQAATLPLVAAGVSLLLRAGGTPRHRRPLRPRVLWPGARGGLDEPEAVRVMHAVVPTGPVMQRVGERPTDPLTVVVAPFEHAGRTGLTAPVDGRVELRR